MARKFYGSIDVSDNELLNFRVQMLPSDPSPLEAKLYYNTAAHELRVYDGTTWKAVGLGGAAGGDLSGTYPNPQIAAGVIVDADVNASAAIQQSKISGLTTALSGKVDTTRTITAGNGLTGGGDLSANRTVDVGVGTGLTVAADAVSLDTAYTDGRYINATGDTMTGALVLSGNPTNVNDAANKGYVDALIQGLDPKASVRAMSPTNVTIAGGAPSTVDGVTLAVNDRVLLTQQTTQAQNGIYTVTTLGTGANGTWTRTTDMDEWAEVPNAYTWVESGTNYADTGWVCTSNPGGTLETTAILWTMFATAGTIQAGAGLTKTGITLDVGAGTGITVAADSVAVDTSTIQAKSEKAAVNGYASLDATTKVPIAQVPTGTSASTVALGNHNHDAAYPPVTRQVIAGAGLTGGGALSADATLNVVGDATLSVAADLISVLSAPKWTTPRSIALTGDVTGSVASVDGSANVFIATTVAAGVGGKRYAAALTASTSQVVTHNLNTRDVVVQVYNGAANYEEIEVEVQMTSVNSVTIISTPALPAGYRVVVLA